MKKETITMRQAICLFIVFLTGSNLGANLNPGAEQDSWVSLLISLVFFLPLLTVYARVMKLNPEKDIFQIIETLFGKIFAKILILLMFWYSLHLFSLVIRNFSEFAQIISLHETPQLAIMLIMILLDVYIVKSGAEALGKWSVFVAPTLIVVIIITVLLALNKMDLSNIQPILVHDMGAISAGALDMVAFPFAETVMFLSIADAIKKSDSPRNIYLWGIAIGALISLVILVRNIAILGTPLMKAEYYPSYNGARIINISDVVTRTEGTIWTNYILTVVSKGTLCLLAAAKGAASLFGVKDYKKMVMPTSLVAFALSSILFKNTMELFAFRKLYPYYALPFQVIIPLLIWITAEIRKKKTRKIPASGSAAGVSLQTKTDAS